MTTTLGKRIRAARQAMHPSVTHRDLAKKLNLSPSAVNLWEAGRTEPDADSLVKISEMFSVSVDWLLGLETSKPVRGSPKPPVYVVPVVPPSALIRWHWDAVAEFLQTAVAYPPNTAAAMLVASDALTSSCPAGAYAVINKAAHIAPGAVVLAHLGRASDPVLRRLIREGREDLLIADDTRYPTYKLTDGAKIIGKVSEVTVRRLLT
jgi:transcriptional regulator with XRE-family HTH domain